MKRIYNLLALLVLFSVAGFTGMQDAFAAAPTTQARNLTFSNITSTSATITWLNGNGTGRIVVVFPNTTSVATIDADVDQSEDYTANADFTSGASTTLGGTGKVVYKGTGSTRTVTVTGLAGGTTYNVKVYEYKIDGAPDPEYNENSGTNNPRSFTTDNAVVPPTALATKILVADPLEEDITSTGFTFTYTNAADATYYELQVDDANDFLSLHPDYETVDIGKPNPTEYELGNLTRNTEYFYRLRTVYNGFTSAWSATGSETTLNDVTAPTVTVITTDDAITQSDAGSTYSITLNFSEAMDHDVAPVITFNADVSTSFTGSGNWEDEDTYKINYTITDVNAQAYDVDVIVNTAEDLAGNVMAQHTETDEFDIDMMVPADFVTGAVTAVTGTVVANYYNSTNESVNVTVPIADDFTLTDGTIKIQAKVSTEATFENVGSAAVILVANINGSQVVNIIEDDLENITNFAENAVIEFRAVITDLMGNPSTTGTASATTLTNDQVAPTAPTPSLAAEGSGSGYEAFYNSTSTGTATSFVLPNDATLNGGYYTLQILDVDTDPDEWISVTTPDYDAVEIGSTPDGIASTATNLSDAQLDAINGTAQDDGLVGSDNDGNLIRVRLVLVDRAGNSTTSTQSAAITVDETGVAAPTPTLTSVGTDSFTGFYNANATGLNLAFIVPNEVGARYFVRINTSDGTAGGPLSHGFRNIITSVDEGPNTNTNNDQAGEAANYIVTNQDLVNVGFVADNGDEDAYSLTANLYTIDASGNITNGANSGLVAIEETRPTVVITRNAIISGTNYITNDDAVSFGVDFTKPVSNFTADDITVAVTGSATGTKGLTVVDAPTGVYTVNITAVSGDGNLGIILERENFTDAAGNELLVDASSDDFIIDNTAPTVTITRNTPTLGTNFRTTDNTVSFDINFNEQVSGFTTDDISVNDPGDATFDVVEAGDLIEDSAPLGEYTFSLTNVDGDGTLGITIGTGLTDLAGNAYASVGAVSELFTIDNTAPTVTNITRVGDDLPTEYVHFSAIGQYNQLSYVGHNITFSEDVTIGSNFFHLMSIDPAVRVDGQSTTIPNTTPDVVGLASGPFKISANGTYESPLPSTNWIIYSLLNGNGGVNIYLDASYEGFDNIVDLAGNPPVEPTVVDIDLGPGENNQNYITLTNGGNEVTMDNIVPTVLSINRLTPTTTDTPTNSDDVTFRVTFSEAVTGVAAADFAVDAVDVTGSAINGTVVAQSTTVYDVTVNTIAGNGTISIDFTGTVTDLAGNDDASDYTAGQTFTIDNTAPTVSITRNEATPTKATTLSFDIDFSEEVSNFDINDITINVSGVTPVDLSGATLTPDNTSLGEYTLSIPSVAGTGTLGITLESTTFSDLAGNQLAEDAVSPLYTVDNTAPTITSIARTGGAAQLTNGATVSYTVTFSECVTGVADVDFSVATDGSIASVTMSNCSTYVVVCSTAVVDPNYTSTLSATGAITDDAGNALTVPTNGTSNETYIVDRTAPTQPAAPVVTTTGTGQVSGYYNIASTGVDVAFTVPNEVGGSYTLQVWDEDKLGGAGYIDVTGHIATTIITADGLPNTANNEAGLAATINISEATLQTLGIVKGAGAEDNNGQIIKFRLNVSDAAVNSITGTNESNSLTIDETAPVAQTITRKATNNPTDFASFADLTTAYTNQDYIAHRVDFSEPVLIGSTFYTASGDDENVGDDEFSTRDNTASSGTPNIFQLFSPGKFNQSNNVSIFDESWLIYAGYVGNGNVNIYLVASFGGTDYVTDVAGNVAVNTAGTIELTTVGNEIILDNIAPNAPAITSITPDNGSSDSDEITNTGELTISGTSEANSTVKIYNGLTLLATTTTSGLGAWSVLFIGDGDPDPLTEGTYTFTATATDAATNVSSASAPSDTWVIDLTAPVLASNGFYVPADVVATTITDVTYNTLVPRIGTGGYAGTTFSQKVYGVVDATSDDNVYFRVRLNTADASLEGGSVQLQYQANGADNAWANVGGILDASISNGERTQGYTDLVLDEATLDGLMTSQIEFRAVITDLAGNTLNTNTAHFGDYASTPVDYLTYSVVTPILSYNTNTGLGSCQSPNSTFTVTVNTANAAYTTSASAYKVWFTDGVTPRQLSITGISGAQDAPKVLTVQVPIGFAGSSGIYDLRVDIEDNDGNTNTFTQDLNVVVSVLANTAALTGSAETICAEESGITLSYTTTYAIGDAETITTYRVRGSDPAVDISAQTGVTEDPTANAVVVPIAQIQNGDVFYVTVSGTGVCTPLTTGNYTVTVNPTPTAATITDNSTSNILCYNGTVVFTADSNVTRTGFNYSWEYSTDQGENYNPLTVGAGVVYNSDSTTVTISNLGSVISTYEVRVIKTNSTTGCVSTSLSSDEMTINKELEVMSASARYSGQAAPGRNSTHTYTVNITQGTATSYEWRVVNGSNFVESNVSLASTTTGVTNNIYFNSSIALGTYYVQVRAVGDCNTSAWPSNGQGYAVTITPTPSSNITFSSVGRFGMTVSWVNGSYDGNILIGVQSTNTAILDGNLDNSELQTDLTGLAHSGNWGAGTNTFDLATPAAVAGVRFLGEQTGNDTSNVIITGLTSKSKYVYRVIDFTGTGARNTRTYLTTGGVTANRNTSAKDGDEFSQPGTTNSISAISPNPAKDFINFNMEIVEDAYVTITIHSLEGSIVMEVKANELFTAGTHNINIPLKDLAAGAYAISISFGQEAILETFMVMP